MIRSLAHHYGRYLRHKADRLLDADRASDAWRVFQRGERYFNSVEDWWMRGICCLIGLGDLDLALKQFAQANALRGVPMGSQRLLLGNWISSIGHMGQLDYVVKLNMLEGGGPQDLILYLPRGQITPNMFLLGQYLPRLTVVTEPEDLPVSPRDFRSLEFDLLAPRMRDGNTVYFWQVAAEANIQWVAREWGPLVKYPEEMAERARILFARLGMPKDAWFVSLHVRESAATQSHRALHDLRNAKIVDYLPAIEEITKRGGWVIRCGDKASSTRLPPMKNVIDYPFECPAYDWLDIFLYACCRFHIGSPSGASYIPGSYGRPTVFANHWPPLHRPWHAGDIFVPKTFQSIRARRMPLSLTLTDPYRTMLSGTAAREHLPFVEVGNGNWQIRDAVVEMLDRFDGKAEYEDSDIELARKASVIMERHGSYGVGTIARDFLRAWPEFVA